MEDGTVTISLERFKDLEVAEKIAQKCCDIDFLDSTIREKREKLKYMEGKVEFLTINQHNSLFSGICEVSSHSVISNNEAVNKTLKKVKNDLKKMSLFSIWKYKRSK